MPDAPAGDVVLQVGMARAVVRPQAGARVCELTLPHPDGHAVPILYPYGAAGVDAINWAKGGVYPLLPYSNRIANGRLQHAAGQAQLPPHPNADPHSLHGHAHVVPWRLVSRGTGSAHLRLASAPCAAWPWQIQGDLGVTLSADALHLTLLLTNLDPTAMPAGVGFHPYFMHDPRARLRYRAGRLWTAGADCLAQASRPLSLAEAFAAPRRLRDGALTDYLSEWDGELDLELPHGEVLHIGAEAPLSHLVVHRPADLPYLCIEPVSHVADGFNLAARGVSGTGCVVLASGAQLQGQMTLRLTDTVF